MSTIHIPSGERGRIRLFAVNLPPDDVAAAIETGDKTKVVRDLLNAPDLDTGSAEIFPVSDLSGVGLASYLADGYSVDEAQLRDARPRLDALSGYVLLLFSDSFGGAEARIDPSPEVTLVGTFSEYEPEGSAPPITAQSAQPYTGAPSQTQPLPPGGRAGSALIGLAVLGAIVLVLWWLFS